METIKIANSVEYSVQEKQEVNSKIEVHIFSLCIWVFILGCVIGYVSEVIYALLKHGHFINKQGMIYGPFNQVYGFGAIIFTLALYKLRNSNKYFIFIIGSIIGGIFEYLCSIVQEILFNTVSWNYSKLTFSFNGRTNPIHAIFWGALGVVFISFCFPVLLTFTNKLHQNRMNYISWVFFIFMIANMTISSMAVIRQNERNKGKEPDNAIECFLDKHYDDDFLKKVYPKMKFID